MRHAALSLVVAIAAAMATPATAAQDSHLGVDPEDIVTLRWQCNVGAPIRILSDGEQVPDFQIPQRHALVITDLEFSVLTSSENEGDNYIVEVQLAGATGPVIRAYLGFIELVQFRGFLRDHLTAGLVVDAAVALSNDGAVPSPRLSLFGVAPGDIGVPNCNAILRGYLVKL